MKKDETPSQQIIRVAKRFARVRDLGEIDGWFAQECQKYQGVNIGWFTAMVIGELMIIDTRRDTNLVDYFLVNLDAM